VKGRLTSRSYGSLRPVSHPILETNLCDVSRTFGTLEPTPKRLLTAAPAVPSNLLT